MYLPRFKPYMFPGQQDDETIELVVREHWMVLALRLLAWILFAAILVGLDFAGRTYLPAVAESAGFALFKSLYLMFLMLGLLIIWVIYYLNVQIITNRRVVDIVQNSLLSHTIAELHLSRLEDVTSEVQGVFGTLLDYGNVYIQTAGAQERFTFALVPEPAKIEKLILDLYEQLPENEKTNKEPLKK